jgi:uncharacterized protein DUF4238
MRQHFVPVFYLQNFTFNNGFFYIYDVKNNRFKRRGQEFAPKSHFYQHDLNTVTHLNNVSYFIETSFTKHDTDIGQLFQKIKHGKPTELTPQEWTYLQYFTSIMYWRNPATTPRLQRMIAEAKNLSPFGMSLKDKVSWRRMSDEQEREMMQNPEFIKFLRLAMPGNTYPEIFTKKIEDSATVITFSDGLPKLVSDNPVILFGDDDQPLHTRPLIFPLTPTKVLVRHDKKDLVLPNYVRVLIDMLLLAQATSYVSCTDYRYPSLLMDSFNSRYQSVEKLKDHLYTLLQ